MIYLLASILCSVSVSVLLKLARKNKIDVAQAVAVNYIVAVALTAWVLKPDLSNPKAFLPTWWLFGALGVLLPSVFVIMGKAVDAAGIVKSDAAQRLSLILPIISAFVIFGEALTEGRLIGIALAFVALFCLLWKADGGKKSGGLGTQIMLLAGVWAGYGIIDILFKQLAKSGTAFSGNLLVAFSLAGILMFGYLFSQSTKWTKEGIIGGIVLGGVIGMAYGDMNFLGFMQAIYKGFSSMFDIFLLSMLTGGLAAMVNKAGGIAYLLHSVEKFITGTKSAQLGISALVSVTYMALANNTVSIIINGEMAKRLCYRYKVDPRRSAALLSTFSSIFQGLIPYGA